jgi:hypothetical protein
VTFSVCNVVSYNRRLCIHNCTIKNEILSKVKSFMSYYIPIIIILFYK